MSLTVRSSVDEQSPLMFLIGLLGMRFFVKVIAVPFPYLFSGVIFFAVAGAYLQAGEVFGVMVMLSFGLVNYFLKKLEFPFVTFIIGFIIGPQLELAIRQSIVIMKGQSVLQFSVAHGFVALTCAVVGAWLGFPCEPRKSIQGEQRNERALEFQQPTVWSPSLSGCRKVFRYGRSSNGIGS